MRKKSRCIVCDKVTSRFLLGDKILNVPICSADCEHGYLESLSLSEENRVLQRLDSRIETATLHEKICWGTAGLGLIVLIIGFSAKNTAVFLVAVFPITLGALFTRHFEDKTRKLTRLRKRIRV